MRLFVLLAFVLGLPLAAVMRAPSRSSQSAAPPSGGPLAPPHAHDVGSAATDPAPAWPPAVTSRISERAAADWQRRLQAVGATYLRVEYETGTGEYHCVCELPLPSAPQWSKPFSATGTTAADAMERVHQQVTLWQARTARRAAGSRK